MSFDIWLTYVATVLLLMSTPGPSQLLMLSNSATNGLQRGIFTAAGDLTANLMQMLAAGLGLAAIIAASGTALAVIKWLGVAYLVYLGVKMIVKADAPVRLALLAEHATIVVVALVGAIHGSPFIVDSSARKTNKSSWSGLRCLWRRMATH